MVLNIVLQIGTENIPGPIEDLHVTSKTDTSISLEWVPATPDNNSTDLKNIDYLVQYGKVDNMTMYETIIKLPNVNEYFKSVS